MATFYDNFNCNLLGIRQGQMEMICFLLVSVSWL